MPEAQRHTSAQLSMQRTRNHVVECAICWQRHKTIMLRVHFQLGQRASLSSIRRELQQSDGLDPLQHIHEVARNMLGVGILSGSRALQRLKGRAADCDLPLPRALEPRLPRAK